MRKLSKPQRVRVDLKTLRFPSLNEMYGGNHFVRAKIKKTFGIALKSIFRQGFSPVSQYPFNIKFAWYFPDLRTDPDNRAGVGQKIVLDSLQDAGIIRNDTLKDVNYISHSFSLDRENPRLIIRLDEPDPEKEEVVDNQLSFL